MIVEIKVPSPGESVSEVEIADWLVEDGDYVEKDQEIAEVESDKATLPLIAEESGRIKILSGTAESIRVGTVACTIDTSAKAPPVKKAGKAPEKEPVEEIRKETAGRKDGQPSSENRPKAKISPLAAKMMEDHNLSAGDIAGGSQRITTKDVQRALHRTGTTVLPDSPGNRSRNESRARMSNLRRKLAQRMVAVRNETAMLTTFNEADMSEVIRLRKTYQQAFTEKHGIKLGFMSFFVKAVTEALLVFPKVNSRIEGDEVVTPEFCDVGIAVQTDKGLMVPVIRNAESMSLAEIEKTILQLADKARAARMGLEDMAGGTFTITNGGVFGSLLSTPLINPPQSAILGMHNIVERPVVSSGQIVIRPMMYIALSYDHRLVDGRDSVTFLVKVREGIENPVELLFNGIDPERILLDL